MNTEELLEKYKELKSKTNKSKQRDFDDLLETYIEKLKEYSGGLVTSDKSEFLKQLTFYEVVTLPYISEVVNRLVDAIVGKK